MSYEKHDKGFTLLEALLVVAAIGVLTTIVILAINPARQLADFRDSKRVANVRTILDGIYEKSIDDGGVFPSQISNTLYQMLGTNPAGCDVECGHTGSIGSSATNSALGQPATASSEYPFGTFFTADKGNDGSNTTYWINDFALGTNDTWWRVDLGSQKAVNKIEVRWLNATGLYNCSSLVFQGSNNDSSWTDVHGPIDTSTDPLESTYNFDSKTYQYWRLYCNQGVNASFIVISEVRIYETVYTPAYTESACIDLTSDLIPDYLTEIPVDPKYGSAGATYYAVKSTYDGRLEVRSCSPEIEFTIDVSK